MTASAKLRSKQHALDSLAKLMGLYGKKPFVTLDHDEKRDANERKRRRRGDREEYRPSDAMPGFPLS